MRSVAAALFLVIAGFILLRPNPITRDEQYSRALVCLRSGDFVDAAALAHIAWRYRPQSEWYWRFRLLRAEALIEAGKASEGLALLDAGLAATPAEYEIRRRVLTARLLPASQLDQARAFLTEARQLARRHSRADLEPEIDLQTARLLLRQRKTAEAEAAFEETSRSALAAGDSLRAAIALNNLGMMRLIRSRCDEAIPRFGQAQQLWRSLGIDYWFAAAGTNLGVCYNELGDFDKALFFLQESRRLLRPGAFLANALGETGTAYRGLEEPGKAIEFYRQARDMARRWGARVDAARWAGNLTSVLADSGQWSAAEQAFEEAIELGPEPRSLPFLHLDAAAIAKGRGWSSKARQLYEEINASAPNASVQWESYAGLANTWIAEADVGRANRNFELAIEVIENHQSDLSGAENRITLLSRLIGFYRDYVDALMAQNEPVKALAVADSSRARVLAQRFGHGLDAARPRQAAEFGAIARESGSVWLSYWLTPRRSFLWVTTANEVRVFRVNASLPEIARLVEEYRGFVESMRDPLLVESEAGRRLYAILIAPAAALLPSGTHVVVVPDGPLHQLSFQTLPVYDGPHPHYWVEDAAISIAPSFGVFRRERRPDRGGRSALIVGDPISPGPNFPRLEFAAGEIANVAKRLSPATRILTGKSARPEVWKQIDLGNLDVIHIAAHAEANRQSPLDSAIILSPDDLSGSGFRLSARDLIDVPLHAELVTLSACRSSGARTYAGEGLVGLTWAFLQAGSRNVVAGLWDVADESTSLLMDRFYERIAAGTAPADALRGAQIELLHTAYSKPYYWGPFQCYRR